MRKTPALGPLWGSFARIVAEAERRANQAAEHGGPRNKTAEARSLASAEQEVAGGSSTDLPEAV
jgi:hypothetical protein